MASRQHGAVFIALEKLSVRAEGHRALHRLVPTSAAAGEADAEAEAYRAWFAHLPALDPPPGEADPCEEAAAVEFVGGGGGGGSSTHDEL